MILKRRLQAMPMAFEEKEGVRCYSCRLGGGDCVGVAPMSYFYFGVCMVSLVKYLDKTPGP